MLQIIMDCTTRYKAGSKSEKGIIAREVLMEVQSNGARFLKRKEGDESKWEICEFNEALQKVCHGIRDTISTMGSKGNSLKKEFLEANAQDKSSAESSPKSHVIEPDHDRAGDLLQGLRLGAVHGMANAQHLLGSLRAGALLGEEAMLHRAMGRAAPLTPSELVLLRNRQLRLLGHGL